MFDDPSGRMARTVQEAQEYLWRFIAENRKVTDPRMLDKQGDFDLYLPWMLEIFDRIGPQPDEKLEIHELQELYMDAAWDLVGQGLLRPGTRAIGGDQPKLGYGNGYSLTARGRERLIRAAD
jgi:hypothetical protein